MELVKFINKYLASIYGQALDSKPKFRVVWSEDLLETRKGLFNEFQVIESIEKVKKYSYLKDKYILEVYTYAFPEQFGRALAHSKDVILDGDHYEPLRVFQTRKGIYLRPDIEICKIICDGFLELISRPAAKRLTEKIANANDVAEMRQETEKFFDILNSDDSSLLSQFRDGEAVVLPGKEIEVSN
jgi:hypothetical protein